jgi:sarcosine oxidase, subunit gamma
MAEVTLQRLEPLAGHRSVSVHALAPATRFSFRGGEAARAKLGAAFGVPDAQFGHAALDGDRVALWLGPDEWLLIAPDRDGAAIAQSAAEALADEPHSLVDVSHRNTGFLIEGDGAADLLSEGCPLDLHDAVFPVGMCTRTVLAKSEIVLWRNSPTGFRVECWRSFARYVRMFLAQAAENQDA